MVLSHQLLLNTTCTNIYVSKWVKASQIKCMKCTFLVAREVSSHVEAPKCDALYQAIVSVCMKEKGCNVTQAEAADTFSLAHCRFRSNPFCFGGSGEFRKEKMHHYLESAFSETNVCCAHICIHYFNFMHMWEVEEKPWQKTAVQTKKKVMRAYRCRFWFAWSAELKRHFQEKDEDVQCMCTPAYCM